MYSESKNHDILAIFDMIENKILDEKKYNKLIVVLSIAIPVVVAVLFGVKIDAELPVFLPPIYATINAITAFILVFAFIAIQNKKIKLHERLMKFAIILSVLFLVMYVAYHMTSDSTKFGGEGVVKYVYYFILLTHILLSVAVIPFVLITYVRAITNNIEKHKKIARITFPLWLYVAITGVVVYIMISPYYI
ncbi:putative membrane protein [Hyunsoonleella jejuensis]|uniref:Putative membrane protein n=2 Tax=Hyunsoonleella jejuensis TaxID=419940 RepID=A0A1H9ABK5_9FLAO|nr:putative membrane protein [Hyunsoonleella jejuensis]